MAAVRHSGGPGRVAATYEWRGATVLEAWKQQIGTGMQDLAQDILTDLHQTIHVVSGEMRDKAFAEVSVEGTKRSLRAGSAADHTIFEEILHHPIREVIDRQAPKLTEKIRAARTGAR